MVAVVPVVTVFPAVNSILSDTVYFMPDVVVRTLPDTLAVEMIAALAPEAVRALAAMPASRMFFIFILVIPLEVHLESQV